MAKRPSREPSRPDRLQRDGILLRRLKEARDIARAEAIVWRLGSAKNTGQKGARQGQRENTTCQHDAKHGMSKASQEKAMTEMTRATLPPKAVIEQIKAFRKKQAMAWTVEEIQAIQAMMDEGRR